MPELHPDVIVTEQEFHILPGDLMYGDGDIRDETYGVPDRHVEAVAEAIVRILMSRQIDPWDVYFSGHDGTDTDPDRTKLEALDEIDRGIEEDLIAGSGEDDVMGIALAEAARTNDVREQALFRQLGDEPVPVYHMSRADHLLDPPDTHMNPIHCAAVTATSEVVVYDRALVDALDLDMPSLTVVATQAQLAPAVLARIHPNYVGVGEGLPEFA